MKFRTEIEIPPFERLIGYNSRIFSIGSCFAQSIADRLTAAKFDVCQNPTGILFNPSSIAAALCRFAVQHHITAEELQHSTEGWFSYEAHSCLSATTPDEALHTINAAIDRAHTALTAADTVIITLGTAWIYTLTSSGAVVANCHKQSQRLFTRSRLRVSDILADWQPLMEGALRDKQVIFTVSPVRHTGDGLCANSLSKATLRVAVAELAERHNNALYFPAYECLIDDLRDYRFYADDMAHPSTTAVDYVWEKFSQAAFSADTQVTTLRVAAIAAAVKHRPRNPQSEEYADFCRRTLGQIDALPDLDFANERAYLEQYCK